MNFHYVFIYWVAQHQMHGFAMSLRNSQAYHLLFASTIFVLHFSNNEVVEVKEYSSYVTM